MYSQILFNKLHNIGSKYRFLRHLHMSKGEESKNQMCKASSEARGATCILFMPALPNRLGYRPMLYVICLYLQARRQKLNSNLPKTLTDWPKNRFHIIPSNTPPSGKILAVAKLRTKVWLG